MSTHKKTLTTAIAVISLAVILALPFFSTIKQSLYSALAELQLIPPTVELDDGEGNYDNDAFGYDVDIDGDYAVVGATWDDNSYTNNGAAYIFYKDPTLGWIQQKKIIGPAMDYQYFGWSRS